MHFQNILHQHAVIRCAGTVGCIIKYTLVKAGGFRQPNIPPNLSAEYLGFGPRLAGSAGIIQKLVNFAGHLAGEAGSLLILAE